MPKFKTYSNNEVEKIKTGRTQNKTYAQIAKEVYGRDSSKNQNRVRNILAKENKKGGKKTARKTVQSSETASNGTHKTMKTTGTITVYQVLEMIDKLGKEDQSKVKAWLGN